jgi:NDP-sugar pyrophosphorylase family protein
MILAAGEGTRLRPLTALRPKPSVPVRGLPLLSYGLELLAHHGVREVIINVHHLSEVLIETAERCCPPGLRLHFSPEPELLGTGGGIRRAAAFLRESDPCLILGGDMILDANLSELLREHRERQDAVTMLLIDDPRVERFGSVGVDEAGCVRRIARRFDLGGEARAGLYAWANAVSARAFDALPDREVSNHFYDWLAPLLSAGARDIRGVFPGGETCIWEPVGTLAEYLSANLKPHPLSYLDADARAAAAGTCFRRDLVVGAGAVLESGAELRRAVVWDGERVPAGLRRSDGVFAGGAFHVCKSAPGDESR